MNINSKHIAALLAASAMAFGVTASAQPQPGYNCYGMGPGGQGMSGKQKMGDPAAFAEQRLTQLKSQLKVTPQQEPLWQAFADKVKTSAGQMKSMHDAMWQQQMSAPDRMNRMVEHMKERTAAMESVNDSFKRLYDALTPEQKTVADKFHPFGGHMGQKRGPGGKGMGGPGAGAPGQGPAPR